MKKKKRAKENLELLKQNAYPGRGIICGMDETGQYLIQIYWIMGRSANSRNRVFIDEEDGTLKTEAANPDLVTDPRLIIYTAMAEKNLRYVVSNGHQTMTAVNGPANNKLLSLLQAWEYEDDAPNFTPRITASVFLGDENDSDNYEAEMVILKKDEEGNNCLRWHYNEKLKPGYGKCLTTYSGDGNPLPPFRGAPYLLPLKGGIEKITKTIWKALNPENRVSLAVKFIDTRTGKSQMKIVNQYSQVEVES